MHNGPVRPLLVGAVGFGAGYVLGAKAGRERYRQIVGAVDEVRRSRSVTGTAAIVGTKAEAVARLGVERLKDTVGVRLGWRNGDQAADAIAVDLAEELATALNHHRHRRPSPGTVRPRPRRFEPPPGRAGRQASSR